MLYLVVLIALLSAVLILVIERLNGSTLKECRGSMFVAALLAGFVTNELASLFAESGFDGIICPLSVGVILASLILIGARQLGLPLLKYASESVIAGFIGCLAGVVLKSLAWGGN